MSLPSSAIQSGNSIGAWIRLFAFGLIAGIVVIGLTSILAEISRKFIALGILGIMVLSFGLYLGRLREVLLFSWVVTLTYNRQFWSFAPFVGDHGAFGPYWMISDLVLTALLGIWLYETILLKRTSLSKAVRFWPWFAPFAIAATLSVIGAKQ